jgi:hypothetical protein
MILFLQNQTHSKNDVVPLPRARPAPQCGLPGRLGDNTPIIGVQLSIQITEQKKSQ